MTAYTDKGDIKPCPFCDFTEGGSVFLESEHFVAVYNIAPILEGHSLVVPRRHIESTFDLTAEESEEFLSFANRTTALLLKTFGGEGFDWSLQQGKVAGQTVPHLHMHIVIRKLDDIPDSGEWYQEVSKNEKMLLDSESREKIAPERMKAIVDRIRKEIGEQF